MAAAGADLRQPLVEATIAAGSALVVATLLAPLDVVRLRIQAHVGEEHKTRGIRGWFREIIEADGVSGLFIGWRAKAVESVIQNFVYFFWLSNFRNTALSRGWHLSSQVSSTVAWAAAVLSILTTLPLEVITAQRQTKASSATTYWGTLREITANSPRGWRELWRGLLPSLILTSNPAIQYAVLQRLQSFWLGNDGLCSPTPTQMFVLAAAAKAVAIVLTYPMIRTKSVMMGGRRVTVAPLSLYQTLRAIVTSEGTPGFYRGVNAQLSKTVLSAALMLALKQFIDRHVCNT